MTPVRLAAAIVLIVLSATAAQAEPILHTSAVAAGEAVPTGGSFSILFPIAFGDVEIRAEDPPAPTLVTHLLTGLNSEGLRVSAMEMSGPEITKPIDGLMETAKTRAGTTVSEISRAKTGDMETLSFALTEPKGGSFFGRFEPKARNTRCVIQFPEAIRNKATLLKDGYIYVLARPLRLFGAAARDRIELRSRIIRLVGISRLCPRALPSVTSLRSSPPTWWATRV